MQSPQGATSTVPQGERRYREEHGNLVVAWLKQHYEIGDRGHTILKATVFHDYLVMCRDTGIESTTAAVFGRFVKKAFPTIKCSRKGLDGRSLHCYRCLKRIDDSSTTSEESSPQIQQTNGEDSQSRSATYLRSSSGSPDEGSGSDSTDEGYDEELRFTIEELSRAGGALFDSHSQQTATPIKSGNASTNWSSAVSSASASSSSTPFSYSNAPVPTNSTGTQQFDSYIASQPQPSHLFATNNNNFPHLNLTPTYYPSQGREYLLPYDPEPSPLPSIRPNAHPIRAPLPPLPSYDPLDLYHPSRLPYASTTTFSTSPSVTTSTLSHTVSENSSTWQSFESDNSSFHLPQHESDDYLMAHAGSVPRGINGYATSYTTTSQGMTGSEMADSLGSKKFYWKAATTQPATETLENHATKELGCGGVGDTWTTSNPTPYPMVSQDYTGRDITPPFHPVHTTQSCPVHTQPQIGPIHASYYQTLHMRD